MQFPILPFRLPNKPTQHCNRCGKYYPLDSDQCTWCSHLSDRELEEFKDKIQATHKANQSLGLIFLILASICLLLIFI